MIENIVDLLWEKNIAEWLTDLSDKLKRICYMLMSPLVEAFKRNFGKYFAKYNKEYLC